MPKIRRVDFYPDDWLAGTIELDDAERGVFISICMLIYATGGPIAMDLIRAYSKAHGHQLNRCISRLQTLGKIELNDGQIANKRCLNELQRARERLEKASQNARKRWNISSIENATALRSSNAPARDNQQPTTNIQQKETRASRFSSPIAELSATRRAMRATSADADFAEWWKCYPHKVGKGAARKVYVRAHAAVGPATLLDAVQRYIANKPADRPWCNAATWLNQERWTDEWPAAAQAANGHDPDYLWRARVSSYQAKGFWLDQFGPPPDDPKTQTPAEILREFGYIGSPPASADASVGDNQHTGGQ